MGHIDDSGSASQTAQVWFGLANRPRGQAGRIWC